MCGFVGAVSHRNFGPDLLIALQAIQHRGQDAAGLGTWDNGRVHLTKGLGLISQAVPVEALPNMPGHAGIAHVRYPTAGGTSTAEDAQPFRSRWPGLVFAHNGNLTNVPELTAWLRGEGLNVLSQCDSEPLMLVMTRELMRTRAAKHTAEDVVRAVAGVQARVKGAYSAVAVLEVDGLPTLVAYRDPHGIRPGCYGQGEDGTWMAASESVALDAHGIPKAGDIPVGAVLLLRHGQPAISLPLPTAAVNPTGQPKHCVFERIYFARADAQMEDGRINRTRFRLGRQLAHEFRQRGEDVDVVIAVPDTSRPAAMAIAEELNVPHREGFIKNRYSGRTFIMPDQATRDAALRLKLNPISEMFEGKRVLLVDDSVVRGSTMRRIVAMLRNLNPAALHLAIFSPPVRNPCFHGIDMPTQSELIAAQHAPDALEAELTRHFGADSVTYISQGGLREVVGDKVCDACFTGNYVVPVAAHERAFIESERRA